MKNSLSRLLKLGGILCLLYASFLLFQHYNPNRLSFSYEKAQKPALTAKNNPPVALVVPGLHINLPIVPTSLKGNEWETTDKGVSYLVNSPVPGEKGNSIMYGHNWTSLLGNLVHIKSGQELTVLFTDGSTKKFTVQYIGVVSPSQSSILKNTSDQRLTIYTCTGFLDTKRFVVVAKYSPAVAANTHQ
jgi:LPXTG-site transpeptidase (sortase) family protein